MTLCHVTSLSHAFFIILKEKENKNKNKIKRKIDKRKHKNARSKVFHDSNFLVLLNEYSKSIEPYVSKGSLWLKVFDHSNSLYVIATRAIVNHTSIGKYWLRSFP